jgi:peptide deformylase
MIVKHPNPILTKKCEIINLEKEIDLIQELKKNLYKEEAVGIAANQIGENKNIFLALDVEKDIPLIFANSEILQVSKEFLYLKESCLSFPNKTLNIKRPTKVLMRYQTIIGNNIIEDNKWFDGLLARIIQHEYDHVNGILFTQRHWNK